jgi:hypothetical protein
VGIPGERPEEADRDFQATEGDGRVERTSARNGAGRAILVDKVDESLASDDDHRA